MTQAEAYTGAACALAVAALALAYIRSLRR